MRWCLVASIVVAALGLATWRFLFPSGVRTVVIGPIPSFEVVSVVDAQTIEVEWDSDRFFIKLFGIEPPAKGEPGYEKAHAALAAIVKGISVVLAEGGSCDPGILTVPERIRAIRNNPDAEFKVFKEWEATKLAKVSVNWDMVEGGWARAVAHRYAEAEKEASRARRGLWGDEWRGFSTPVGVDEKGSRE